MRLQPIHPFFLLFVGLVLAMAPNGGAADVSAGHVYLSGQVHRQGAIGFPQGGELTISQAIILDGGLGDFADARHVKILRKKSDGTSQIIHVDYIQIMGDGGGNGTANLAKDIALVAGDIIIVPSRETDPSPPLPPK